MFRIAALTMLVILTMLIPAQGNSACHASRGLHVRLFGGVDDPDVLVWDSRDRLVRYAGGSSDTRVFLLPHALLNRPGTIAIVQTCVAQIVHPKFRMDPADAVGVLILSGKYRGRYGWVSSSDIHGPGIPEDRERW
jgi:hypothetical protein